MTIQLNDIPASTYTPLVHIEINNTGANTGLPTALNKVLIFGQQDSTATVAEGTLNNVFSPQMAQALYGRSSMLAAMVAGFKTLNADADVWVIGLDDDPAGIAAAGGLSITGTATASGTLSVMIGGIRIRQAVYAGDTGAEISTALIDTVNANLDVPVIASAYVAPPPPEGQLAADITPTIVFTARHAGECGNDIDIRYNYYTGEMLPAGVAVDVVAMTGGTANPDVSLAIAAMGDTWWNYTVNPYTDAANLDALNDELVSRWGPMKMIDSLAFSAFRGTLAETTTFGLSRNDYLMTVVGTGLVPQPPYVWAACMAAESIASLVINPARPLQTLAVSYLLPPAAADRWPQEDRNTLLHDGISTYTVNSDTVQIERMVTLYQLDAYGNPDTSYLNLTTPATLSYIRYATRLDIEQKFPRCSLADDGTPVAPGQAIVTPAIIKNELIALGYQLNTQGLIENMDAYIQTLQVERDTEDRDRVNVASSPDIVNQFRQFAMAMNFIN
jgi:phage tail sheath gpL-like